MIDIFRNIDNVDNIVCSIADDNASIKRAIMGVDEMVIDVTVDSVLDVAVGDYIRFENIVYELNRDFEFNQKSEVEYQYSFVFEHPLYRLLDKLYINKVSKKATFTLMGRLADFVGLLVWNINKTSDNPEGVDAGWEIGEVPASDYKTLTFGLINCRDVLTKLSSDFGVEFYLKNKVINFVDHIENETGLVFSQGKGKGLYTVSQKNVDTGNAITRVYPIGGTQNVPIGHADADGHLILPEVYIENFSEYSKIVERGVEFADIYPSFIGAVSDVSGENNSIIKCAEIDFNIKEVAVGNEARINFLTGDLMGKSFSFQWSEEKKEITIIEQEDEVALPDESGKKPTIPSALKQARVTDEFNFTGLNLPNAYVMNAIEKLRKAGNDWLEFYSRKRIKFDLNIDYRYLRGKRMVLPGDLITLKVQEHNINKVIRVTSVDRKIKSGELTCVVSNYLDEKWEKKIEGQISSMQTAVSGGGGSGLKVEIIQKNDTRPAKDSNVFSAVRTLAEILANNEELKKLFLGKYGPDRTEHLLEMLGGTFVRGGIDTDSIEIGDFVPGWLGRGSLIKVDEKTGKTRLEIDEILARDRFETMEYRFNRIDVIDGEQWSTFAFGTIKSVDVENQIAYLNLVDGELMSSHKNDLNRGIFHNISSANATESKIDDCGFYTQAGFSTSYFTPTELLAKGNGFKYALRAGTTQHPCAGMKFAAYGNPADPNRRMSRVTNLKHTIYLKDVSVWQIDPNVHYGAAYGDLTGITINGVEFNGYSSFQTNGYFKGHIEFLPGQKEELKGKDGYSVSLSSYDAVVAVNSDGEIDSSLYDIINIVSGKELAYTGDYQIVTTKYKIQTTIQATCGATKLEQSDVIGEGKYVVSVTPAGCEYHLSDGVITVTKITQDKATLDIEINCEGIAVIKKTFTLTRVYAERGFTGADGKDIEFIYLRSKVDNAPVPDSENTDGFVPAGWTDNPTGTTSEFIYELIARRIKVNGTWGAYSNPAPWSRYAKDGKDGDSVTAKYSINGTDWHDGFVQGDIYMQLYTNGVASGSINRIVAEDGADGQYTDFQFAKSTSATVAPTEGWQDAPPVVSPGQYLWMRSGVVIPPLAAPPTWTAVRIGGVNGNSVDAEYSADGESWHTSFATGDLYMRQRIGEGEWTPAFRIVGETGKNGQYTDYQFAANELLTDAPVSGWQDAPPVVSPGQYLWMRSGVVVPPETEPKTWTAVRIGGVKGDDGKDGPGFEIIFCRTKTNAAPAKPTGKNQDQYVPDGWTNDQTGTSALWPHEFASQRRKINGVWGSFSEPALWANYSFDGDDAYSVALSSYDAVVSVNSVGEIDSSLYDVVNIVSGQQLAYTGTYQVTTTKYKIQTAIYAWHGVTQLVHSDTADPGKYSVTIEAVGCEYSIANGVITITRISQDKATLNIVINCEGKITVNKMFTLTRVYAGRDANLLDWLKPWDDNKTMIDGEWVASPKMFSGKWNKDTDLLTGIAQGVDCITIDGKKRTGIFALVDGVPVFELDPMTKKYLFRGRVEADEGIYKGKVAIAGGKIQLNEDGSGQLANGTIKWDSDGRPVVVGKFTTSLNGKRIELDSEDNSIKMYNEKGYEVSRMSFVSSQSDGSTISQIILFSKNSKDEASEWTYISPYSIELNGKYSSMDLGLRLTTSGISFIKDGKVIKHISNS